MVLIWIRKSSVSIIYTNPQILWIQKNKINILDWSLKNMHFWRGDSLGSVSCGPKSDGRLFQKFPDSCGRGLKQWRIQVRGRGDPPFLDQLNFFLSPSPPPPPYLRIWITGRAPLQFEGLDPPLLRYGKTRDKKRATCFETLLENELNNDVARFTSHKNKSCNLICCETG